MKWFKRHTELSVLLLITLGLLIWYSVASNGLAIVVAGSMWGLVFLDIALPKINYWTNPRNWSSKK